MRATACGLTVIAMASVLVGLGCQPTARNLERESGEETLFGPVDIRIHPFTAVKDWDGDTKPDGVEVLIELLDRFRDPTKATGTLLFELYTFRRGYPDPRGERLDAWRGSLLTFDEQRMHYSRISRTYSFQLAPQSEIRFDKSYVLMVSFEHAGNRLSSQIILEAQPQEPKVVPATQPAGTQPATTQSSTQPAQP